MKLPLLRVFTFAVIRSLMPLGVAQDLEQLIDEAYSSVIRGLMPLGVAQLETCGEMGAID